MVGNVNELEAQVLVENARQEKLEIRVKNKMEDVKKLTEKLIKNKEENQDQEFEENAEEIKILEEEVIQLKKQEKDLANEKLQLEEALQKEIKSSDFEEEEENMKGVGELEDCVGINNYYIFTNQY